MAEPQQTPDLHTIFGMDEKPVSDEPTVQIERDAALGDGAPDGAGAREDDALGESFDDDAASPPVALSDRGASPSKPAAGRASEGQWKGITRASRRGTRSRFLTDVIVELGFATDEQVKDAVEASRSTGTTRMTPSTTGTRNRGRSACTTGSPSLVGRRDYRSRWRAISRSAGRSAWNAS